MSRDHTDFLPLKTEKAADSLEVQLGRNVVALKVSDSKIKTFNST